MAHAVTDYAQDFYAWTQEQAALLRGRARRAKKGQ